MDKYLDNYFKYYAWMRLYSDSNLHPFIFRKLNEDTVTYSAELPIIDRYFEKTGETFWQVHSEFIDECCSAIDDFVSKNPKFKEMLDQEIVDLYELRQSIGNRVNYVIENQKKIDDKELDECLMHGSDAFSNDFLNELSYTLQAENCALSYRFEDLEEFDPNMSREELIECANKKCLASHNKYNFMFAYVNSIIREKTIITIGALSSPIARAKNIVDVIN